MRSDVIRNYFYPSSSWVQADEATAKFHWILKLRWVAIIAQLFSIIPGTLVGFLPYENIGLFVGAVLTMCAINVASMFFAKNLKVEQRHLFLQITADLVILLVLLFITGGLRNPFVTLLIFHTMLSSLLLKKNWNLAYFGLLAIGVFSLYWASPPSAILNGQIHTSILLMSQLIIAFVIWRLTSWLSETLLSYRQHVSHLQQHQNRMDRFRSLGVLTAGFSHEFATPLNTIKLRIDRMERKLDQNGVCPLHDDIRAAKAAIDQCESTLKNLIGAERNDTSFSLEILSLDSFVKKICEGWQSEHPSSTLIFSATSEKNMLTKIPRLALSQTILNLLDNSWQASKDACLKVDVSSQNQWLVVCISDDGPGLSPFSLEKLGEPFITTKSDGTGLGLYNAVNLMEALGGKFTINNIPTGGAEAKLSFQQNEIQI